PDPRAPGQGMVGPVDGPEGTGPERLVLQERMHRVLLEVAHHAQVRRPLRHQLDRLGRRPVQEGQLDLRVAPPELPDRRLEEARQEPRRGGPRQPPQLLAPALLEPRPERREPRDEGSDELGEEPALARQLEAVAPPEEEGRAELALEGADLLPDGGTAHAQRRRRAGEAPGPGRLAEGPELLEPDLLERRPGHRGPPLVG